MRGGSFFAVLLIVLGVVMIVTGVRGRSAQFIEALTNGLGVSTGTTGVHTPGRTDSRSG